MSDNDDFMMDSEEENYDFEYEDDDEDQDGMDDIADGGGLGQDAGGAISLDMDVENMYYNAKALKEDNGLAALKQFDALRVKAGENQSVGEWVFKALKQSVKVSFKQLNDMDGVLKYYKELLKYSQSSAPISRNYFEKSLNNILDLVSSSSQSSTEFMETVYTLTLESLASSTKSDQRLWLKTKLKLAKLYLSKGNLPQLEEAVQQLHEQCDAMAAASGGKMDQSKNGYLLEVLAIEIQMYTTLAPHQTKKLKQVYNRTLKVDSAIPHPMIMGVIRECGGKMHLYEKQWERAQKDFFESFRNYDEAGSLKRIQVLKYLVLSAMLSGSDINPFESQETKPYRNHNDMIIITKLLDAYQRKSIYDFQNILNENKLEISNDPFLELNLNNNVISYIRSKALLNLIQPYSRIKIDFIAKRLFISSSQVRDLLVSLIIDGDINGKIDQVENLLDIQNDNNDVAKQLQNNHYSALGEWNNSLTGLWQQIYDSELLV